MLPITNNGFSLVCLHNNVRRNCNGGSSYKTLHSYELQITDNAVFVIEVRILLICEDFDPTYIFFLEEGCTSTLICRDASVMERRVALLPEGIKGEYTQTNLPLSSNLTLRKPYLIHSADQQVYELKLVDGTGPYEPHLRPQLKAGGSITSWIVDSSKVGFTLESGSMLVATKFSTMFLLLLILYKENLNKFMAKEDLIDMIEPKYGDWVTKIPLELDYVCDITDVGGETYYKFSVEKSKNILWNRINRLADHVRKTPDKQILAFLSTKFNDVTIETPQEVKDAAITLYAYELVLNLYCLPEFKEKEMTHDFLIVTNHLELIKSTQKSREVSDKALEEIASTNSRLNSAATKRKAQPTKVKASKAAKVVKGKGALDSFFRPA